MTLDYPLNLDDKRTIEASLFSEGEVTLVSGSYTIYNPRIKSTSKIFVQRKQNGGTTGNIIASCGDGSATITSSSASDTSVVYYLIRI
jgi:uncharacterized protein (AIM24 family)